MKVHPNLCYEVIDRPGFRQETANAVLWDRHSGDPFFMPPGGDPMRYLAKGFKTSPPKGYVMDLGRPYRPPVEPLPEEEWEPDGHIGPAMEEWNSKYAELTAERDKKALQEKMRGVRDEALQDTMQEFIEMQKDKLAQEMKESDARIAASQPDESPDLEPMRTDPKPPKAETLVGAQEMADNEGPKGKQAEHAQP